MVDRSRFFRFVPALSLCCVLQVAQARISQVTPAPGDPLGPLDNIQLQLSPPMSVDEFVQLGQLIEIRDEQRGFLYWNPSPVGQPPYETVFLIPLVDNYPWITASRVRIELKADSSVADTVTLEMYHTEWPFVCSDCEWIGESQPYSLQLQGEASEMVDLLPMELDRDGMVDLTLVARDRIVMLGLVDCAGTPQAQGLGGELLSNWSVDRRMSTISLSGHQGQGFVLNTGGQEEQITLFLRTGPDDVPQFEQMVLEEEIFTESPKLALAYRARPDHLCQDLLVANRGGELILYPNAGDCSGLLPDSAEVLLSGLGDPLDMLMLHGQQYPAEGDTDYLLLLESSPEPLKMAGWDGEQMHIVWTAETAVAEGLQHLERWNDFDPQYMPDVIAWREDGRVVVFSNIDPVEDRVDVSTWTYPEPLHDVESIAGGGVLFAGHSGIRLHEDPRSPEGVDLLSDGAIPAPPSRLRVFDANADGDHDMAVLYQDGRLNLYLDEVVGVHQLTVPDTLYYLQVPVGEEPVRTVEFHNRSVAAEIELTLSDPPVDPGFPFSWSNPGVTTLFPGDSLLVEVTYHAEAVDDSCYGSGQFSVAWNVPGCQQHYNEAVALCAQAGFSEMTASGDSLFLGTSCGGHEDCEDGCPGDTLWISNEGDAWLRVGLPEVLPSGDDSTSAPESFCVTVDTLNIQPGDSAALPLYFCPPMEEPWPWLQSAILRLAGNAPADFGDTVHVDLTGLLECPYPPYFTGGLPSLNEDQAQVVDLGPLIEDPDGPLDQVLLAVEGVVGTEGQLPDSVLQVGWQAGFELNLEPQSHANSDLYPELGLALLLTDSSHNETRDTLTVTILPADDPPVVLLFPPEEGGAREGALLELEFNWVEVDGDSTEREFLLSLDAEHTQPVQTVDVPEGGSWTWSWTPQVGDSADYSGELWWRFSILDLGTPEGYLARAEGRLVLYTRPPAVPMVEDQDYLLDFRDWTFYPGADTEGWQAEIEALLGHGAQDPDSVIQITATDPLAVLLQPAGDVNSALFPGLGLRFRLDDPGGGSHLDTLALEIEPADDPPRLVEAPAGVTELHEGAEYLLNWVAEEVDGDAFSGSLTVSPDAQHQDPLAQASFDEGHLSAAISLAPQLGDSLRFGGQLHWRFSAADTSTAMQLATEVTGVFTLRQAGGDPGLSLLDAPPTRMYYGDTLEFVLRIDAGGWGYAGPLTLAGELDGVERVRHDWDWLELPAGVELDTSMTVGLPLAGACSCWRIELSTGNPADDPADNEHEGCVDLFVQPVGVTPNVCTPNGDGFNDRCVFDFGDLPPSVRFRLEIYDLNGRRVLARSLPTGDRRYEWDAAPGGHPLLPGVYPFVMLDGNRVIQRGQVGVAR